MRASAFYSQLQEQLEQVKAEGLYKSERIITSSQQAEIAVASGDSVINFCANNYLGLANHPSLIEAAKSGLDGPWLWCSVSTFYLWYTRHP